MLHHDHDEDVDEKLTAVSGLVSRRQLDCEHQVIFGY